MQQTKNREKHLQQDKKISIRPQVNIKLRDVKLGTFPLRSRK